MKEEEIVITEDQGTRVNVELGTQLVLQFEGNETRFKSSLVGLEPGDYLIVRMPHMINFAHICSNPQIIVRYVRSGTVYGFQSQLAGYITKPFKLLFLSYPTLVSSHNLRKQQRVECFIPVIISVENKEFKGAVLDISGGGCLLNCPASAEGAFPKIQIDDEVKFSFQLPGLNQPLMVTGKARNITQESDRTTVGLQFDPTEVETRKHIESYIENMTQFKDF